MVSRMNEVDMQQSENNQLNIKNRRRVKSSTTLNRRYVRKPSVGSDIVINVKRSPKIRRFEATSEQTPNDSYTRELVASAGETLAPAEETIVTPTVHPIQKVANERVRARAKAPVVKRKTASELKDEAIKKALASAERIREPEQPLAQSVLAANGKKNRSHKGGKVKVGIGRTFLALSCAVAAMVAIVYFVSISMPDISLKVAAMQSGIDASYPGYIPRGYALTDITSENSKLTLKFKNSQVDGIYSITEEKSSWDSNALMINYVNPNYGENYVVVREQGLTIYISDSDAAWVNRGIVYKLKTSSGSLTKKQIRSIAVSL